MDSVKSIRFAVLGCGHIGKRHIEIILKNTDCSLVAVADTDREKLELLPGNSFQKFSSVQEMLQGSTDIDVVSIATPNGLHLEHALAALKHGCHVVIEKPMALTAAGCQQIIDAAKENSRNVFCVMQNRYSPPAAWLKEIVEEKLMGKIFMVQINCFWNRDERYYTPGSWHGSKALDGGVLFTQFSHFADLLYWVFGDITNIRSTFANFNHQYLAKFDDSGMVNFDLVNGGMGSIHFSTSAWKENLESSITILGEKGSVKIGGQYMNEVQHCAIHNYKMPKLPPTAAPNNYGDYKGSAGNHGLFFNNVVQVLHNEAPQTILPEDGMKVVDMIERIYRSGTGV